MHIVFKILILNISCIGLLMLIIHTMFTVKTVHKVHIMQLITFANRKGGVSKTTSAWAVAQCLAHAGERVLLVDCDPQRNLTMCLPPVSPDKNLAQVADGSAQLIDVMQPVGERLWLVPATDQLTAAEKVLGADMAYPLLFKNGLAGLADKVDYVIFDTSPSPHSPLALAAMTASNVIFIPVQPEYFAYEGLQSLLDIIDRIKKNYNPGLRVGGVFLTKYAATYRRSLHHQFVDMMKSHPSLGERVLQTTIRENVAVAEAQVQRMSLYDWSPQSNALKDYEALTEEITGILSA